MFLGVVRIWATVVGFTFPFGSLWKSRVCNCSLVTFAIDGFLITVCDGFFLGDELDSLRVALS